MLDKNSSQENENTKKANSSVDKDKPVKEALKQAEKDIEKDTDLQPNKDDDLDEGELARKEGHP